MVTHNCSLLVIEHNLEFIAAADYVLDLGPDGGDTGGQITFTGSPAELMQADTLTGQYLHARFAKID